MILIADSGSTKADFVALDNNGENLFTTETLGLNPEVLTKDEVIARLDQRFDILHNKNKVEKLFFYGAGCGTDRMKNHFKAIFEEYRSEEHTSELQSRPHLVCRLLLEKKKKKKILKYNTTNKKT